MRALSVLSLNLSLGVTFIVTLMTTAVSMARETQSSTPTQVSLVGWVRSADSPVLILPRLQNESPSMAVNAYLSSLQQMESGRFFPPAPFKSGTKERSVTRLS